MSDDLRISLNSEAIEAPGRKVILEHNLSGGSVLCDQLIYAGVEITSDKLKGMEPYTPVELMSSNAQKLVLIRTNQGWSAQLDGVVNKITLPGNDQILLQHVHGTPRTSITRRSDGGDRIVQYGSGQIGKITRGGSGDIVC